MEKQGFLYKGLSIRAKYVFIKKAVLCEITCLLRIFSKNEASAAMQWHPQRVVMIFQLTMEGFPESKGVLYSRENTSNFLQPIPLDKLLSLVMEPNLGNVEDLLEADLLCIEKIQGLVAPKPKVRGKIGAMLKSLPNKPCLYVSV